MVDDTDRQQTLDEPGRQLLTADIARQARMGPPGPNPGRTLRVVIGLHSADEKLMPTGEAAAHLSVSAKTLMRHVKAGRISYVNIGTATRKAYRFTANNLKIFIENQKTCEVSPCLYTRNLIPHFTNTTSTSNPVAFTALQKPETKKRPK